MHYGAWLCISSLPGFVQFIIIFLCVTQELLPLWPAHLNLLYPARTTQVSNVKVGRVFSNRAALVSRTPLTLHQARGFPVYFMTYQPSS